MFRYIQPDCQCLAKHCQISELDYFAVYVPIKLTNINIPDLARLEIHAEIILNEHLLTTYVMSNVYKSVGCYLGNILNDYKEQIWQYYNTDFGMFFLTAVLTTLLNYQTIQTRMD